MGDGSKPLAEGVLEGSTNAQVISKLGIKSKALPALKPASAKIKIVVCFSWLGSCKRALDMCTPKVFRNRTIVDNELVTAIATIGGGVRAALTS